MPTPSAMEQGSHSPTPKRPRLHSRAGHASTAPRPPPSSISALPRTLIDIVGATSSRADAALGHSAPQDAWASLGHTVENLPVSQPALDLPDGGILGPGNGAPSAAGDGENANNAAADAAAATATGSVAALLLHGANTRSAFSASGLQSLPTDHGLKRRLRVASPTSLSWARMRSQAAEYRALCDVTAARSDSVPPPPIATSAPDNAKVQRAYARGLFLRSLLSFRFPPLAPSADLSSTWSTLFPLSTSSASSAARRASAAVSASAARPKLREESTARLSAWHSALQSVYFGFRDELIPSFHVLLPGTALLFIRTSGGEPRVVFSASTPGLRGLLSDHLVSFRDLNASTDPGDNSGRNIRNIGENGRGENDRENDYEIEEQQPQNGRYSGDNPGVPLVVDGTVGTHATFNFLMSVAHGLSGSKDVPTIVCDAPFRGGTAISAEVEFARAATIGARANAKTVHSVTFDGLLTARQVRGLCMALRILQDGHFSAVLEPEERTVGLEAAVRAPVVRNTSLNDLAGERETEDADAENRGGERPASTAENSRSRQNSVSERGRRVGRRRQKRKEEETAPGVIVKVASFPGTDGFCAAYDATRRLRAGGTAALT